MDGMFELCRNKFFQKLHMCYCYKLFDQFGEHAPVKLKNYDSSGELYGIETACSLEIAHDGYLRQLFKNRQPVVGDLELVLSDFDGGPEIKIPVSNGKVALDQSTWQIENQVVQATIFRQIRGGMLAHIYDTVAFLPNELIENRDDLWRVGARFKCKVIEHSCKHALIIQPIPEKKLNSKDATDS